MELPGVRAVPDRVRLRAGLPGRDPGRAAAAWAWARAQSARNRHESPCADSEGRVRCPRTPEHGREALRAIYEYRCRVASIYDGDTIRLDVDCGFNVWLHRVPFRLAGIDAPELGTVEGRAARDWLRGVLPVGAEVISITQKDRAEKYGRYLVTLYLPADTVLSLNQQLIDAGHARPYDGGAR